MDTTPTETKAPSSKFEPENAQAYNDKEQELIHQLMQSRLEQKEELEYDPLTDYEVPPPSQFSMLAKPTVTIKYPHITFSTSSIRLFAGIEHVLPIISRKRHRFGIVPLSEEESASLKWVREKDGKMEARPIIARKYLDNMFSGMKWSRKCRYKVFGQVVNSPRGLILVFDLDEALLFTGTKSDVVDPKTGETKKQADVYFPSQYKGKLGTSYEDYVTGHQMSLFDDFDIPIQKTYDDVPEEALSETAPAIKETATELAKMATRTAHESGTTNGYGNN